MSDEAFLQRLKASVNATIAVVSQQTERRANVYWRRVIGAPAEHWKVSDREQWSKGLFSYSREPTERTLKYSMDITREMEEDALAHKAQFADQLESDTFKSNYLKYLKDHLLSKVPKGSETSFGFAFHHELDTEGKPKKNIVFLDVTYVYKVV